MQPEPCIHNSTRVTRQFYSGPRNYHWLHESLIISTVLTHSHGSDKLSQCGVCWTVSDVVANVNESFKQFWWEQSSKLPPVSLCAVKIPVKNDEEDTWGVMHV